MHEARMERTRSLQEASVGLEALRIVDRAVSARPEYSKRQICQAFMRNVLISLSYAVAFLPGLGKFFNLKEGFICQTKTQK